MGWHYAALEDRFRRISGVNGALAILDWDTAVDDAPQGRGRARRAVRRPQADRPRAADRTPRPASSWPRPSRRPTSTPGRPPTCARCAAGTGTPTRSSRLWWRRWRAPPPAARCSGARRAPRPTSPCWCPSSTEVVRLVREEAAVTGAALGLSPYDALLDGYQPDLRDADVIDPVRPPRGRLPPLLGRVLARQAARRRRCGRRAVPGRRAEGARPRADGGGWASTSRPAGSTRARTRSAAARPPTSASPPATARTSSSRR